MREQLLQRITPAIEKLAEQLVDLVLERIDMHINQLELAFDAAASSFASDILSTAAADTQGTEPVSHTRSRRTRDPGEARKLAPRPSSPSSSGKESRSHGAAGPVRSAATRSPDQKRTNTCRKCGAIGFTARTCGKTHNVSTSLASAPPSPAPRTSSPATSSIQAPPHQPSGPVRGDRSRCESASQRVTTAIAN